MNRDTRPSDAAIAQAFRENSGPGKFIYAENMEWAIWDRAREIDAARPAEAPAERFMCNGRNLVSDPNGAWVSYSDYAARLAAAPAAPVCEPAAIVTSSGINYTAGALPLGTKLYTAPRVTGGREPSPNWCPTCDKRPNDPMAVFCRDSFHLQAATGGEVGNG